MQSEQLSSNISFEFENEKSGSTFMLTYELFNNDFSPRWFELFKRATDKKNIVQKNGIFYGSALNKEEDCVEEMTGVVNTINNYITKKNLSQKAIELIPHIGMSQDFLNDMHKRFEIFRPDPDFDETNIQHTLASLNTLVHRCEGFLSKAPPGCHIEVNFQNVEYGDFKEGDYNLFTANKVFGNLYLTYGVTGVPSEAAFFSQPNDPPLPQPNYCSGCFLYFNDTYDFDRWEEAEKLFTEKYGLDVHDPKLAFGYIPLGKLVTPCESREQLFELIRTHQKIRAIKLVAKGQSVELFTSNSNWLNRILENLGLKKKSTQVPIAPPEIPEPEDENLSPVVWPNHPEILHHLDYRPYIALNIPFDPAKMLKEAFAQLEHFHTHRGYDTSSDNKAEWKSLGIQALNGDHAKTSYHTSYGVKENAQYKLTEIAARCPETVKFLRAITDFKQCERVRYMLLEPGAKIHVHRDSEQDVLMAVNISLNMPEGCKFYADANADGTHNPYTVSIPFKDSGSVILFNNAKYHHLVNNSDKPRMHMIFHGPIRYPEKSIIEDARKQNGFSNQRELIQALVAKKCFLGLEIKEDSNLYRTWKTLGLSSDIIPKNIKLVVMDVPVPNNPALQEECRDNITKASLFPLNYEVVRADDLDSWMNENAKNDFSHLVIIGAGTLINDPNQLVLEIFKAIVKMKNEGTMVCGQIINHEKEKDALPYLHEQFLLLDVNLWKSNGKVRLGKLYGNETMEFPAYKASEQNIHDDYTPLHLVANPSGSKRIGKNWWGTELMAASLSNNIKVLNVPASLRLTKKFAYPNGNEKWQYEEIKNEIDKLLDYIQKQTFFFNNENLSVIEVQGFKPERFITVASGFKYVAILKQYWGEAQPEAIHIIDYGKNALAYSAGLVNCADELELFYFIADFMKKHPYGTVLDENGIRTQLTSVIKESFENDIHTLMKFLNKLRPAVFQQGDFIQNPDLIVNLIDSAHKTLFWHSNAWHCNGILYKLTLKEIEENYLQLIRKIKQKLGLPAWKKRNSYETIFGKSFSDVHTLMTDGGFNSHPPMMEEWEEIQ